MECNSYIGLTIFKFLYSRRTRIGFCHWTFTLRTFNNIFPICYIFDLTILSLRSLSWYLIISWMLPLECNFCVRVGFFRYTLYENRCMGLFWKRSPVTESSSAPILNLLACATSAFVGRVTPRWRMNPSRAFGINGCSSSPSEASSMGLLSSVRAAPLGSSSDAECKSRSFAICSTGVMRLSMWILSIATQPYQSIQEVGWGHNCLSSVELLTWVVRVGARY